MGEYNKIVRCKMCGSHLPRAQIEYMLGNPKYSRWCRDGYCSLGCFEKHSQNLTASGSQATTCGTETVPSGAEATEKQAKETEKGAEYLKQIQ